MLIIMISDSWRLIEIPTSLRTELLVVILTNSCFDWRGCLCCSAACGLMWHQQRNYRPGTDVICRDYTAGQS
jgi:hypothetical protein